jgi:hypothetical protein
MKKKHYFFFAAVIGMALFAQYDLGKRLDRVRTVRDAKNAAVRVQEATAKAQAEATAKVIGIPTEEFVAKFKTEATQIAKIQNNPEAVQKRMQKLAEEMNSRHVDGLYEIISDDKSNADERALAVELLTLKNNTASLIALQNFVANTKNINGEKWDQKKEFETVLRAQAVEGIAGYPEKEIAISTLNYLQQRVDQKFLNDRISRASMNLMYSENKSLTQQDEEALKKLVE